MAKYTVQAPDGKTLTIEGPDGASHDEVLAQAQQLYKPQAAPAGPEIYNPQVSGDRMEALPADGGLPNAPAPAPEEDPIVARAKADVAKEGGIPFVNAMSAGIRSSDFGILDHLVAGGRTLIDGGSYADNLKYARAEKEAEAAQSTPGNILGNIAGAVASGMGAGRLVGAAGGALAEAASPAASKVGNFLQSLTTLQKAAPVANAAKVITGAAAQGGTNAAGQGDNPLVGAAEGAGGAAVLGGGFLAAKALAKPAADLLRISSAQGLISRFTNASRAELQANADAIRASGHEPTLLEVLPPADRERILSRTTGGRPNVQAQAEDAIIGQASKIGPEMSNRAQSIVAPQRAFVRQQITNDLANARGGTLEPDDAALIDRAMVSPTDMSTLRDVEGNAIMAPHRDTPVAENLTDLFPQVPNPSGSGPAIQTDPEVSAMIRTAAGTLRNRGENGGVTAGDVASTIQKLRTFLGKPGVDAANAERAIQHLQDELNVRAPDAGAAHQQVTDAYAARSRMIEGMDAGYDTSLRDAAQVGTNRGAARVVRNAYDTPEGANGRVLGQSNRILQDLQGSPAAALSTTRDIASNATGREIGQNIGGQGAADLTTAAQTQDRAANTLASALSTVRGQAGSPDAVEALMHAVGSVTSPLHAARSSGRLLARLRNLAIPESRARTMVDMLFSQDPRVTQRAIAAIGNTPGGGAALNYIGKIGTVVGTRGNDLARTSTTPAQADIYPDLPLDSTTPEPQNSAVDGATPAAASTTPATEGSSPYTPALQKIYDTESPEMLDLIGRVAGQESGGNQFDARGNPKTSKAGAIGVMQVMPDTAPEAARLAGLPWDENAYRNDPNYNKVIGIAYLSQLLRKYDGDVAKALAAYNAGPGRADAALKMGDNWRAHLPAETQDYIQRVS